MTCKLSHDEDGIPKEFCRACNPDKFKTAPVIEEVSDKPAGMSPAVRKLRLRKLRAEEKRLSDLIDDLGPRNPSQTRKLYDAIKIVEREIDQVRKAV